MENDEKVEAALRELSELSQKFEALMEEDKKDQEAFWASLSKEEQLKAFCAVSRRIHEGEIEKRGTYRYVLYDVFGFGPESYLQAQLSGYLDIHNCIFTGKDEENIIKEFAKFAKVDDSIVSEYYKKKYF